MIILGVVASPILLIWAFFHRIASALSPSALRLSLPRRGLFPSQASLDLLVLLAVFLVCLLR